MASKPAGISEKVIRILEIYTIVAQKQFPSVKVLMERLNVSDRTIYRYLELINLIDPIEYDREKGGYKFTSGDRIKKLMLSDEELITLFAAGEAVSHLGTAFGNHFKGLVDRLCAAKGKPLPKDAVPIIIKTPDMVGNEKINDYLMTISLCMKEKRSIDIAYRAQHTKETTKRTVDPYGLVFYEGAWVLIAFCNLRKKIRSFALDRIKKLRDRWRYFQPQTGFDLKEYLSHSWGIYDEEEITLTVRFDTEAADYILRKDAWHPSEKRVIFPDGSVELTFTVAGAEEIKRWIYSWLPHAEVIKPEWLRKQVRRELSGAARHHR